MPLTLTPIQIARAYQAVTTANLTQIPMSFHDARALVQFSRALTDEYETVFRLEKEMAARHGGTPTASGYAFPSDQAADAYRREHETFCSAQEPIVLPAVNLSAYADDLRITAAQVEALDGLITFDPPIPNAPADTPDGKEQAL